MDSRVSNVVLFKELANEDHAAKERLESIDRIVLGTHMEHRLVLVVSDLEEILRVAEVEVLFEHGNVIVLQSVKQRKVAVVVRDVRARPDLINNGVLHLDADNVLDGLTFIVLLAASLKELIATCEPVEDILVAVAGADEKRVLTKVILLLQGLILVVGKNL